MSDAAPRGEADLLASSAATWRDTADATPRIPADLTDRGGPIATRLPRWRARHARRARRARDVYQRSRNPERGLPVARSAAVIAFVKRLLRDRRRVVVALVVTNALAGVAGLVVPRLLGHLVDLAAGATDDLARALNGTTMAVVAVVLLQAVLTFLARWVSAIFGQDLLAAAREDVVRTVLRLPLSTVETASAGDLVTRITRDVSAMSGAVRWALPQLVISGVMSTLTVVAMFLNSWILAIPVVVLSAMVFGVVRRYLQRAPMGYITEGATYSTINTSLTESVEGARTVEAWQLEQKRIALTDEDLAEAGQAERYTMSLRNIMFLFLDFGYNGPLAFIILLGTWGYANDWVTLGQITAAAIYTQQLVEPMDRLVETVDRLQVGIASTTRLLGIAAVPQDRSPGEDQPSGVRLMAKDLRFAYREGHDVLHGVDLDLRPGERLAIVGPSGSGKSTLGRLIAGINPARTGEVTVGGVNVMNLPLQQLRNEVALVTQEHHVFVGTIRDNIVLARETTATDDEVRAALSAMDALDWVERLPNGLQEKVGSGQTQLTPAQAQQVALARLVIANPHTLVLDEATSLMDPRTARHLEGSMAALLHGRAVVAIAHRLHTAHDADRIAVVIDGRIAELGSHDELMELGGEYAALWTAWTS